jgi:hypothetical protein
MTFRDSLFRTEAQHERWLPPPVIPFRLRLGNVRFEPRANIRASYSACCALDATGQTAVPPRILRNSRRPHECPPSGGHRTLLFIPWRLTRLQLSVGDPLSAPLKSLGGTLARLISDSSFGCFRANEPLRRPGIGRCLRRRVRHTSSVRGALVRVYEYWGWPSRRGLHR